MRNWFFYQEKGKTIGPLTVDDMRARIRAGRIRLYDLIYKEGEPGWRMALEHADLREEFKGASAAQLSDRPWVCLRRKSEDSFDFVTLGPYSTEDVREALKAGSISYNDYAWKNGFAEWKRIGGLGDFNRRVAARAEPEGGANSAPPPARAPASPAAISVPTPNPIRTPMPGPTPSPTPSVALEDLDGDQDLEKTKVVPSALGGSVRGTEGAPPPVPAATYQSDGTDSRVIFKSPKSVKSDAPTVLVSPKSKSEAPTVLVSPKSKSEAPTVIVAPKSKSEAPTVIVAPKSKSEAPTVIVNPRPASDTPTGDTTGEGPSAEDTARTERRAARARERRRRQIIDWSIIGSLVLILVGAVLWLSLHLRGNTTAPHAPLPTAALETQSTDVGELTPIGVKPGSELTAPLEPALPAAPTSSVPQAAPTAALTSKPEKARPVEEPVERVPTQLLLSVSGNNGSQVHIDVRSNGSADYPVFLQIVGLPGQVAEGASFYRYLKLKATGHINQPLDVGALHLPQGRFILRADSDKLHKEMPLSIGVGETQYRQSVAHSRKMNASGIWSERLTLFRLSTRLTDALSAAQAGQHFSGRGLEALAQVHRSNGAEYILFDDWWELKQIQMEAKTKVTPALVERARKERDRMATFSVWRTKS